MGGSFYEKIIWSYFSINIAVVLAACGNGNMKVGGDDKKITVGASPAPHAEILEKAKPLLEKKGYDLDIKTINDYTTPNKLLDKGEINQSPTYTILKHREKG